MGAMPAEAFTRAYPLWRLEIKRIVAFSLTIGLFLSLGGQVSAGGTAVTARLTDRAVGAHPKSALQRGWRYGVPVPPGYPNYRFNYPSYGHYSYHRQPLIVLYPYVPYPASMPVTIVVSSPFFCLAHQMGYVSRVGMLDHLSGTHKIPLDTARSLCPEGNEICLVDIY